MNLGPTPSLPANNYGIIISMKNIEKPLVIFVLIILLGMWSINVGNFDEFLLVVLAIILAKQFENKYQS